MSLARRWPLPLALLLTAVACKEQGDQGSAAAGGGGAVIGAALSLTGPAASYGAQQRAGIQAALDEVNQGGGVKLSVLIEDDASTKEQGITVFQKFINRDKVSAIIGPTLFKTAGVLYGNDDVFTKAGYDVMQKALADQGVTVAGTQTFAKPDRDYNAQLTALIAAKPDVLVVSALADNAASIVAQARQRGWTGPILGGNGFNSPAFIKNAGAAAEDVMVGTSWNSLSQDPANQKFLAAMKKAGVNPDQFSAQAYTGVIILAEAIRQSGGKTGREDIEAGLGQLKDLETPLGKFSFTPGRDAQHEPSVQQVKDGKFQTVQ